MTSICLTDILTTCSVPLSFPYCNYIALLFYNSINIHTLSSDHMRESQKPKLNK